MAWSSLPLSVTRFLRRQTTGPLRERARTLTSRALEVPTFREARVGLEVELSRARRYEHPLSIALLTTLERERSHPFPRWGRGEAEPGTAAVLLDGQAGPIMSFLVAGVLAELLRQSDHVAYAPAEDRFVLALPETDRGQARRALDRIEPEIAVRMGMGFGWGIATFPDDGFTLVELVERAEEGWRDGNRTRRVDGNERKGVRNGEGEG